jgi:hypothetical protein
MKSLKIKNIFWDIRYFIKDFFEVFGTIILIILGFIICLYLVFIVGPKMRAKDSEISLYRNEKLIIVKSNATESQQPIDIKIWLVQRAKDTTEYAELKSLRSGGRYDDNNFYISNALWYKKKIGDTLYFDYILRRRFFKILK